MIRSAEVGDEPLLRVMALHALLYCERLFISKRSEEIRVADANVYAGRRLHLERLPLDDETPEYRSLEVSSETWRSSAKLMPCGSAIASGSRTNTKRDAAAAAKTTSRLPGRATASK